MLYDLLYPWGKGSVEAQRSEGVIATAQAPSGPCGVPKPGCGKVLPWQHLDRGRNLSGGGGEAPGFCFLRCQEEAAFAPLVGGRQILWP